MATISEVRLEDNSEEVLTAEASVKEAILEAIGAQAEYYAKEECPVDTGRLRNSISHATDEEYAYIGTNVEYAPAVEFMDVNHKVGKAHFLRDAASTHGEEYKEIAEQIGREN